MLRSYRFQLHLKKKKTNQYFFRTASGIKIVSYDEPEIFTEERSKFEHDHGLQVHEGRHMECSHIRLQ